MITAILVPSDGDILLYSNNRGSRIRYQKTLDSSPCRSRANEVFFLDLVTDRGGAAPRQQSSFRGPATDSLPWRHPLESGRRRHFGHRQQ